MSDPDPDMETLRRSVAEQRAGELVRAPRNAVAGPPHWRLEAAWLLEQIDNGVVPEPRP